MGGYSSTVSNSRPGASCETVLGAQEGCFGVNVRSRSRNDRPPTSPSRHTAKAMAQVVIVHRAHRRHRWRGRGTVVERWQMADGRCGRGWQITASQLCQLPGRRKDQGSMTVYPGLAGICGTQRTQLSSMATRVVKVHEREWEVEEGSCSSWKFHRS